MQTSLIFILIFCVLFSAVSYFFGFIKPPKVLAYLSKSAFLFMTIFMIPFLVIVLWRQSGAEQRLAETGVLPYPGIIECVGITMDMGEDPTWIFRTEASAEEVMAFYRQNVHRPNWEPISWNKQMMIFKKGSRQMSILFYKGWQENSVTYVLRIKE